MDKPINIIALVALIICALMLIEVLLLPSMKNKKKKKKNKTTVEPSKEEKEWSLKVERLQSRVNHFAQEIEEKKKKEKEYQEQLALEKAKIKKLQEKITRERGWHEKEQKNIELFKNEKQVLKDEVVEAQETIASQHTKVLQLEGTVKELRVQLEQAATENRALSLENKTMIVKINEQADQVRELKKEVVLLKRKKDAERWVAKEDYDKIKDELVKSTKELERITKNKNQSDTSQE